MWFGLGQSGLEWGQSGSEHGLVQPDLHCLLSFEEQDGEKTLLLPREVLEKYLEADVIEMNVGELKEKILYFDSVNNNDVISDILPHIQLFLLMHLYSYLKTSLILVYLLFVF